MFESLIGILEMAVKLFPSLFRVDMLVGLLRRREVVVPEDILCVSPVDSVEEVAQSPATTVEFEVLAVDVEICLVREAFHHRAGTCSR